MSDMMNNNTTENQNISEVEEAVVDNAQAEAVDAVETVEAEAEAVTETVDAAVEEESILQKFSSSDEKSSGKKRKSRKKKDEDEEVVYHKPLIKKRKPNRSIWGDIFLYIFLALVAILMFFPIVYAVESALKPLDELYKFPPRIFAHNPTLD